ncbi:uncharacterized protein LOC121342205 [Onychostruthus taczanowskii]|uniref:uncharacterized protein LOC121342205 n=1 Tax=Onychostruthus taczanowskii TaxID=356909 RepID=UPI001B80D155|nr:uncharacterized protein LOC121342205 [Onychostruthus taczanowskii]
MASGHPHGLGTSHGQGHPMAWGPWGHFTAWGHPHTWGPRKDSVTCTDRDPRKVTSPASPLGTLPWLGTPQGQCHLHHGVTCMACVTCIGDIPPSTPPAGDTHGAHPHTGTATTGLGTLPQNCHRAQDTVTELSLGWGHRHRTVTGLRTLSQNCHCIEDTVPELSPGSGHCHRNCHRLGDTQRTVTALGTPSQKLSPRWGHCYRTVTGLGTLSLNCHRAGEPPGRVPMAQLPPPAWGHQSGNPGLGTARMSPVGTVTTGLGTVTSGNCHHGTGNCWHMGDTALAPTLQGTQGHHGDITGTPGHVPSTVTSARTGPGGGVTVSPCASVTRGRCHPLSPVSPAAPGATRYPWCHPLSLVSPAVPSVTRCPRCHPLSLVSPAIPGVTRCPQLTLLGTR